MSENTYSVVHLRLDGPFLVLVIFGVGTHVVQKVDYVLPVVSFVCVAPPAAYLPQGVNNKQGCALCTPLCEF